ncbi:MAG: hypothetical protein WCP14_02560 [bacterium]
MTFEIEKYYKYKKGPIWYLVVVSVFSFFSFRAYMANDYYQLFLYALVASGLLAYILIKPLKNKVEITESSIHIDKNVFLFVNMDGYILLEDKEVYMFHLFMKSKWKPTIKLTFLKEQKKDVDKVDTFLEKKLKVLENEKEPSMDYLQRLFRF